MSAAKCGAEGLQADSLAHDPHSRFWRDSLAHNSHSGWRWLLSVCHSPVKLAVARMHAGVINGRRFIGCWVPSQAPPDSALQCVSLFTRVHILCQQVRCPKSTCLCLPRAPEARCKVLLGDRAASLGALRMTLNNSANATYPHMSRGFQWRSTNENLDRPVECIVEPISVVCSSVQAVGDTQHSHFGCSRSKCLQQTFQSMDWHLPSLHGISPLTFSGASFAGTNVTSSDEPPRSRAPTVLSPWSTASTVWPSCRLSRAASESVSNEAALDANNGCGAK